MLDYWLVLLDLLLQPVYPSHRVVVFAVAVVFVLAVVFALVAVFALATVFVRAIESI